jgi:hypothetical protein
MHIGFVPFELEHANISNQGRYIPVETGHIADVAEPMRSAHLDMLYRGLPPVALGAIADKGRRWR